MEVVIDTFYFGNLEVLEEEALKEESSSLKQLCLYKDNARVADIPSL